MNIGIIWSDGTPENVVKFHTLLKSKEDKHFATYFNDDWQLKFIKESELVDETGVVKPAFFWSDYSAFFILAELNWQNHAHTDLYGIKLAQQLRLKNVKAPVFICSFVPEEGLIKKFRKKILSFRGHYFIQLPQGFKSDLTIEPLDDFELDYCKTHLCNLKGAIRDIYHTRQHALNTDDIEQGKLIIKRILSDIQTLTDLPEELQTRIRIRLNEVDAIKTPADLNVFIKQDESVFMDYFSDEETAAINENLQPSGKWDILILDDVPADVEKLINALKDYGFKNKIYTATSYDEAVKIINEDKNNHIAVVISDYRLEKEINGITYLKGRQGYSFVEWLSKQDRLNEIFVFSGLARSFLKSTFKRFNIRVNIMSKYEFAGTEKTNEFAEEIIEKGNEVYGAITNMPSCKGWAKLNYFYVHYRKLDDYEKKEAYISQKAREVLTQIKHLRETIVLAGVEEHELQKLPAFSQVQVFQNLTSKLAEPLGKKYSQNKNLIIKESITREDGLLAWKDPMSKEPNYMDDFFVNKLIARRIAWWLLFHEGIHPNTVYSLLMKGEYFNNYFSFEENIAEWRSGIHNEVPVTTHSKLLINTSLAIAKTDFPNNMLIEEKNWFKYEMNWDPNDLTQKIAAFEDYFFRFFESYLEHMNTRRKAFSQLKDRFIRDDKFVLHHAEDVRKVFELSIVCLEDVKHKLKLIEDGIYRFNEKDKICSNYFSNLHKYLEGERIKIINRL